MNKYRPPGTHREDDLEKAKRTAQLAKLIWPQDHFIRRVQREIGNQDILQQMRSGDWLTSDLQRGSDEEAHNSPPSSGPGSRSEPLVAGRRAVQRVADMRPDAYYTSPVNPDNPVLVWTDGTNLFFAPSEAQIASGRTRPTQEPSSAPPRPATPSSSSPRPMPCTTNGRRSRDAHDRYANIEVSYLLQKMEEHQGAVILASNLSRNIDQAFSRRMHYVVEFPLPDETYREQLWHGMFPPQVPLGEDVDFHFLAKQFSLAGGDIKNVALGAAFLAAQDGQVVTMKQLIRAMARQMIKQGKVPSSTNFKQYHALISQGT